MGISKPPTYHSCLKWEISWPDIVVAKEITGNNDFDAMYIARFLSVFRNPFADWRLGKTSNMRECWNRQTGQSQKLLTEMSYEFKPHLSYY